VKHGGGVHGLTTAAGLWCVAAIGLACGQGLYSVAAVSTGLVLCGLWFLARVERFLPKVHFRTLVVRCPWRAGVVAETVKWVGGHERIEVADTTYRRIGDDLKMVDIRLNLILRGRQAYEALERELDGRAEYEVVSVGSDP
jgi:uncharacterized membrane protein YhiD involved in acid resistance